MEIPEFVYTKTGPANPETAPEESIRKEGIIFPKKSEQHNE